MTDLALFAADHGIRHFLFSFADLFGVQRAKLVPASAVADLATNGAGFAGFAAWLLMTPADPDVLAHPDPSSLMVLPWQPEVAWVATDLSVEGVPLEQAPRRVLQRQLQRAAALGFEFRSGVEAEFFLLDPLQGGVADRLDQQTKPCYDQLALMRRYPLISELIGAMEELGYVSRRQLPENRKNIYVYLTPKGRSLEGKLVPMAEEVNHVALAGVSGRDAKTARAVLMAMIENLAKQEQV